MKTVSGKVKLFLSIELILYVAFIFIDAVADGLSTASMGIKYIGVVLCFFYTLFFLPKDREEKDANLVRIALLFTVLADTCIIWSKQQLLGVLCFIVVQLSYFYRLNKEHWKSIWVNVFLALGICGLIYDAWTPFPFLLLIGSLYFVSLCRNVWDSFMLSNNRFFQLGMLLFLLCDCNVILRNLHDYLPVGGVFMTRIYPVVSVMIWIYYLPSQVLLALSVERQ